MKKSSGLTGASKSSIVEVQSAMSSPFRELQLRGFARRQKQIHPVSCGVDLW
jgi:hypothetical protein